MLPPPLPEAWKLVVCAEQRLEEVALFLGVFPTCGASAVWPWEGDQDQMECFLKLDELTLINPGYFQNNLFPPKISCIGYTFAY